MSNLLYIYICLGIILSWQPSSGLRIVHNQLNRYYDRVSYRTTSNHDQRPEDGLVTALFMSEDKEAGATPVKLPILQIYKTSELAAEFICGNDLVTNIEMFKATLPSMKTASGTKIEGGALIQNVYSDDQLERTIAATEGVVVLKLFRDGCKKCKKLEPIYDELSRQAEYSHFQWLQSEVGMVPAYTKTLKQRLLGLAPDADESVIDDCTVCKSTGFTDCTVCSGTGFVKKGDLALFCSACTGYKKVRCATCGGKCLKCTSEGDTALFFEANMD